MTVNEARSRCAALAVLAWDDAIVSRELARASAAFLVASPQVSPALDAPGTWWIGAGGFEELGGERALSCALQEIASVWHPLARVGLADTCVAARAATWASRGPGAPQQNGHRTAQRSESFAKEHPGPGAPECARPEPRIVPPGECTAYLSGAPLALIPMDGELRESLTALGLRTAGAFAALDALEVERRWGPDGLASWRLANGQDDRRPVLARTDATRFVSTELPMSAATMEPVLFIVRAALGQLIDALVRDGLAAAAITITLTLDDQRGATPGAAAHAVTREVRPAKPLARVAPLFERCRALLDQWTLPAPVCAVTVTVSATAPMGAEQGDLLAASWRDPGAADAAFERLRGAFGALSVVRPAARDEHRPEKAGAWEELNQMADGRWQMAETAATPSAVCRLLAAAEPVDVEAPRGVPRTLGWRGRRIAITRAVGPERLSGDWWKDQYARDYWRCESDELARDFLLYRDAAGWRLQGWYD
jgi:protein ImuB